MFLTLFLSGLLIFNSLCLANHYPDNTAMCIVNTVAIVCCMAALMIHKDK